MNIFEQKTGPRERVREILSALNRKEHRVVERRGIKVEKYKEIRSEPVSVDASTYSGTYLVPDLGYSTSIQVGKDATVAGNGSETSSMSGGEIRRFTLKNGKIQGALLTADKIYEDGATEEFEGVFINRTESNNPTDKGTSSFGIGVVGRPVENAGGVTRMRLFYKRQ